MLSEISTIWARLKVHWHALAVLVIASVPVLLQQLEGIDLTPFISYVVPEQYVSLVIALLPFTLAVMKPLFHLEDPTPDA